MRRWWAAPGGGGRRGGEHGGRQGRAAVCDRRGHRSATLPPFVRVRCESPERRGVASPPDPGPRERGHEMADYDVIVRNGTVVDGTGAPRRQADVGIVGDRIVAIEPQSRRHGERATIDADRPARHAGLRRHPHPPRRPAGVGSDRLEQLLPRHHQRGHGQLRRDVRPVPPGGPRVPRRADGERRGHPARRDPRRPAVGLGDLRRVPRLDRADAQGPQRRRDGRPLRAAPVRDGRARSSARNRRPPTTWRPCATCSTRRCAPARSASAPAARICTRCPTADRSRAPTPDRTSCTPSPTCSVATAPACSRAPAGSARANATIPTCPLTRAELAWMGEVSRRSGLPGQLRAHPARQPSGPVQPGHRLRQGGERHRRHGAAADHGAQRRHPLQPRHAQRVRSGAVVARAARPAPTRKLMAIRDAAFRARLIDEADAAGASVDVDHLFIVNQPGGGALRPRPVHLARRRGPSPRHQRRRRVHRAAARDRRQAGVQLPVPQPAARCGGGRCSTTRWSRSASPTPARTSARSSTPANRRSS